MVFWTHGFTGTSLDDLAAAMGMNRPSIYNAFGDKQAIYRAALAAFRSQLDGGLEELAQGSEPRSALNRFFETALDVYMSGDPPLGCFIFCTAPAEAIVHPDVRADMLAIATDTDKRLKTFFTQAQKNGTFPIDTDAQVAAQLTQAILHSVALRARAGQSHALLRKFFRGAVEMICR